MDNFSGDAESANKGPASKVTKETKGLEKSNFLSVLNLEHSRLPNSFGVDLGILSGIELLRLETLSRKVEVGGVLFTDNNNEPKIKVMTPKKGLASANLVHVSYREIDENNIDFYLERSQEYEKGRKRSVFDEQVCFVDSNLAGKYGHFFQALIQEGKEIIIDGAPIAAVHTHPSGNVPSRVDFSHVLWGLESPEIVVTSDWTYFLIPTKQTPDLAEDPSSEFKISDFKTMIQQEYEQEVPIVAHLMASSSNTSQQAEKDATNAVRFKMLQDNCAKYDVGFYVLEKGKAVATRIV